MIAEIKRLHNEGRTLEELETGLGLDKQEIEVALGGGIYARGYGAKEGK